MLQSQGMCEQFQIGEFKVTACAFLRDILNIDYATCFISDESDLDDFRLQGDLPGDALQYRGACKPGCGLWDMWVLDKIQAKYGITLETTRFNLVTLFHRIEQNRKVMLH